MKPLSQAYGIITHSSIPFQCFIPPFHSTDSWQSIPDEAIIVTECKNTA